MNRKQRKAIKLARKHGRAIYQATNPFWRQRPLAERPFNWRDPTIQALREMYLACK